MRQPACADSLVAVGRKFLLDEWFKNVERQDDDDYEGYNRDPAGIEEEHNARWGVYAIPWFMKHCQNSEARLVMADKSADAVRLSMRKTFSSDG